MNTRTYAHRLRYSHRNFVLYIFNIPIPVVVHLDNIHRARLCRIAETIYCVTFRRSFKSKESPRWWRRIAAVLVWVVHHVRLRLNPRWTHGRWRKLRVGNRMLHRHSWWHTEMLYWHHPGSRCAVLRRKMHRHQPGSRRQEHARPHRYRHQHRHRHLRLCWRLSWW